MIKEERWSKILKIFENSEIVAVTDIPEITGIPATTLRRDLSEMSDQGVIIKLHGRIKLKKQENFILEKKVNEKIINFANEKNIIAQKMIRYIQNNSAIFIDAGSSTLSLIKYLNINDNLVFVTNSPLHAEALVMQGFDNVYLTGGKYKVSTGALVGTEAIRTLQNYSIDIAILGVNGYDNHFLYTTDPEEANIKKMMIDKAKICYVLADDSKINKTSFVKFGNTSDVVLINER